MSITPEQLETIEETLELLKSNNDALKMLADTAIADRDRYKKALEEIRDMSMHCVDTASGIADKALRGVE